MVFETRDAAGKLHVSILVRLIIGGLWMEHQHMLHHVIMLIDTRTLGVIHTITERYDRY